jgi:hypothetical protein
MCIGQSFLTTCHTSIARIPRYDGLDVVFYPIQNPPMSHVLAPLDTLSDVPGALCVASNQPIVLIIFTCSASWVALACCPSCNGAPDPKFQGTRRYVRRFALPQCPSAPLRLDTEAVYVGLIRVVELLLLRSQSTVWIFLPISSIWYIDEAVDHR